MPLNFTNVTHNYDTKESEIIIKQNSKVPLDYLDQVQRAECHKVMKCSDFLRLYEANCLLFLCFLIF